MVTLLGLRRANAPNSLAFAVPLAASGKRAQAANTKLRIAFIVSSFEGVVLQEYMPAVRSDNHVNRTIDQAKMLDKRPQFSLHGRIKLVKTVIELMGCPSPIFARRGICLGMNLNREYRFSDDRDP